MDNVTHTLVGLMLARAASSRNTARDKSHTSGMMMIAANLPDIDAVSLFGGALSYIQYHRWYAHSLALAPAMALLPPLLIFAIFRVGISIRAYVLSLVGVLSHLALDWTNGYGVRLLLPFSHRWLRLDITDIVDPWILALLALAVAAPALSRLVSSEIGAKSGPGARRGWAWFALLALLVFEAGRYTAHARALAVMNAHLFNGSIAQRLTALPTRFDPLRWRGVAEGEGFAVIVPVNLAEQFDPDAGSIYYNASPSPALDAARRTRPFEIFGRFSQLPFWKATPIPEGERVELIDLRFGTPQSPGFEAAAVVDPSGHVLESQFGFGALPVKSP